MRTRQIVHDILRNYPETRDDDKKLLKAYLYTYYPNDVIGGKFIEENFDFISCFERERRYWQNTKGMFLPSEGVKKGRKKKETKIIEEIREEKKNFASNIYNYAKRIIRNK